MVTTKRYMAISVVSGVVFAVATGAFLWGVRAETARAIRGDDGQATRTVLVATADLKPGDQLSASNTASAVRRADTLPDGAVAGADRSVVLGKRVGELVLRGEPITERRVVGEPSRLDSVAAGFAAVTLGADPVRALGGEVTPGMRVAVLATSISGDIVTLGDNVEVLSVSNQRESSSGSGTSLVGGSAPVEIAWVTVAVAEGAVAAVVQAAQANQIYLVRYGATPTLKSTATSTSRSTVTANGASRG